MPFGFYIIMGAQFFSSLADNALLVAAIALLMQLLAPEWMTPMLKFFFTVSYVLFAAVVGAAAAWAYRAGDGSAEQTRPTQLSLAIYFSFVTASHGLLDGLTDGGLGVALFAPFSADRFFLPWRPIQVSPIGPSFFSARGLDVLISEAQWVWVPCLVVAGAVWVARKTR